MLQWDLRSSVEETGRYCRRFPAAPPLGTYFLRHCYALYMQSFSSITRREYDMVTIRT